MWDYRVIKTEDTYTIAEVYYRSDGTILGAVYPVDPLGETLADLQDDLRHYALAASKPVIEEPFFVKLVHVDVAVMVKLLSTCTDKEILDEYRHLLSPKHS